jgi:hypothetical protein
VAAVTESDRIGARKILLKNAPNRRRLHGLMTSFFLMAFGLKTNLALARSAATGTPEDDGQSFNIRFVFNQVLPSLIKKPIFA